MSDPLLRVEHLATTFQTDGGLIRPVDDVSFAIREGRTLCVVGESGCGKSVTSLSIMGLLPQGNGRIERGHVYFEGRDLVGLGQDELRTIRGNRMAMIFQEPMTALNPVFTIGDQIAEVIVTHRRMSKREALKEAVKMLEKVAIPLPEKRVHEYPHQLSGGMKQRVMIAMALACNPRLLIADEPTTALDVTVQAQILRLMKDLQKETGAAIMFITHDLGVVAEIADDVIVMYAGQIVEQGDVYTIFEQPKHPYTQGLLRSIPSLTDRRDKELYSIKGIVPSLDNLPVGCRFQDRCPYKMAICETTPPPLAPTTAAGHLAACHLVSGEIKS